MANEDIIISIGADDTAFQNKWKKINQEINAAGIKKYGAAANSASSDVNNLTKQSNNLKQSTDNLAGKSLPTLRYALYDVASTTTAITLAFGGAAFAAIKASADFESAFTNIERTTMATGIQLENIKTQFLVLAREIPISFAELTTIGQLGAQLGVAESDLAGFAKTVAEFSATTNVSTEQAAQSFGAIGNLLDISADQYVNLGSAIAYAGVNSVATEKEILSVTTGISAVSKQAGLSNKYIGGLATALASLRVPAEQSRGALTRTFQEINRAAVGGGEQLQGFATVMGMTADEAKNLAATNMDAFFQKFITSLSGLDSQQLTSTLDALNLSDIRVTNTLTRLSQNLDVVGSSVADFSKGFDDGSFLAAAYGTKVEDLASKFQILQNSVAELAATFGDALSPVIGPIIDQLSKGIQGISDALQTDAGKYFAQIAGSIAIVIASLSALTTTVALAKASILAFDTVAGLLGLGSATQGIKSFINTMLYATSATRAGSIALAGFRIALLGTGIGIAVALLGTLAAAFQQASVSAENSFNTYIGSTAGLAEAVSADTIAYNQAVATGNTAVASSYTILNQAISGNTSEYDKQYEVAKNAATVLGVDIPNALSAATDAANNNTVAIGENTMAWFRNMAMQNEELRTLVGSDEFVKQWELLGADFNDVLAAAAANGQAGVHAYFVGLANQAVADGKQLVDTINGIRVSIRNYSGQLGNIVGATYVGESATLKQIEKIAGGWSNQLKILGFDTKKTTDATEGFDASLQNLGGSAGGASKKIRTLIDYANDLSSVFERAFNIRFSGSKTLDAIAKSFSSIAKATADAREEIDSLNADIDSLNADRALQEYFLSVSEAYGDTLQAQKIRANLAKIDTDLIKKTKDLQKAQDKTNTTLVGNSDAAIENRSKILELVSSYQEHIKALAESGVGQDELRAKTAQLKQDFIAQATQLGYNSSELGIYAAAFDDVTSAINNIPRDITVDINIDPAITALNELLAKTATTAGGIGGAINNAINSGNDALQNLANRSDRLAGLQSELNRLIGQEYLGGWVTSRITQIRTMIRRGNYADGGYTGAGGKYEVAGIVHRGEYVVPKEQVNQTTGLPYYMSQPRSFAQGGYTGQAGPTMVMLSPEDRALLRNAGGFGEVVLYANNEALARSVNAGNRSIVAAGGRP